MKHCYSWEGEDVLAWKIFHDVMGIKRGVYLDIGAHHPFDLSNTAMLHEVGWHGVNVDATPGSMAEFEQARPGDVNIEAAISDAPSVLRFAQFENTSLNGFLSDSEIRSHEARGERFIRAVDIECMTVQQLFDRHVLEPVDFLSIDVEGMDARIIAALPDDRLPKMICVEVLGCQTVQDVARDPITALLSDRGYGFMSRLHYSCMFIRRDCL